MNKVRNILKKINFIFFLIKVHSRGELDKSKIYSKYYGVKIGRNVRITGSIFFPTEAYLIEIGDNVTLTNNVTFHSHDGGVGILREELEGINIFGRIKIGNNVFIGSNSIILPNVVIGDNVVIGAGSVVTKNIPNNVVAAGNPAKILKPIDIYKQNALAKGVFITEKDPSKRKKEIIKKISQL